MHRIERLRGERLLRAVVLSGFGAIWIDRGGFDDRGGRVTSELLEAGAREIPCPEQDRYVLLDAREYARRLREMMGDARFALEADSLLTSISWLDGFYGSERAPDGTGFRWSRAKSRLLVENPGSHVRSFDLTFSVESVSSGDVEVAYDDTRNRLRSSPARTKATVAFTLQPGGRQTFDFRWNAAKVLAPKDATDRRFMILNPMLTVRE
jgi:hypothetical protein